MAIPAVQAKKVAQNASDSASAAELSPAAVQPDPPAFRIPDVSPRVLWRLVKHYCDITYLYDIPENKEGCAWARNTYYRKKFKRGDDMRPISDATLRRWRRMMLDCGWIESLGSGPKPKFAPLVSPRKLLSFLPAFKRLLTRVLSGYRSSRIDRVPVPVTPERELNSNKVTADAVSETVPASAKPALSEAEQSVVVRMVDATDGEITPFVAEALLGKCGVEHVQNALDTLRYYRKTGKAVGSPGGFLRSCAERLKAKTWTLNGCVIAMLEKERRVVQRAAEMAEERKREQARLEAQRAQKAEARAAADIASRQAQAERLQRIPGHLRLPWETALGLLATQFNKPTFEAHIRNLLPIAESREGNRRTVTIEYRGVGFTLTWLERKRGDLLEALAAGIGCTPDRVDITFVSAKKGSA